MSNLIKYHDSPISTINYFVHHYMMKLISKDGFRVVVSGVGADELYTGYYDHSLQYLYETRKQSNFDKYLEDWRSKILKHLKNPIFKDHSLYINNPKFRKHIYDFSESKIKYLNHLPSKNFLNLKKNSFQTLY